jgi:hypothetical protein
VGDHILVDDLEEFDEDCIVVKKWKNVVCTVSSIDRIDSKSSAIVTIDDYEMPDGNWISIVHDGMCSLLL